MDTFKCTKDGVQLTGNYAIHSLIDIITQVNIFIIIYINYHMEENRIFC